jgi:hypothetical protein
MMKRGTIQYCICVICTCMNCVHRVHSHVIKLILFWMSLFKNIKVYISDIMIMTTNPLIGPAFYRVGLVETALKSCRNKNWIIKINKIWKILNLYTMHIYTQNWNIGSEKTGFDHFYGFDIFVRDQVVWPKPVNPTRNKFCFSCLRNSHFGALSIVCRKRRILSNFINNFSLCSISLSVLPSYTRSSRQFWVSWDRTRIYFTLLVGDFNRSFRR